MDWLKEGRNWPNHTCSRFVELGDTRWHVQQLGDGPEILLLHGSGATTHSFGILLPTLAQNYSVTAIDLPGHGFSSRLRPAPPTLPGVSRAITTLLKQENIDPVMVIGHSAGGAIAVNMAVSGLINPYVLVAINGAFFPFPGFAGHIFPAFAKLLFLNPLVPRVFSLSAGNRRRISDLIKSTGSELCEEQIELYQRAFQSPEHVKGTLAMMANWDLSSMQDRLRALDLPMLQIIGGRDRTIDPGAACDTAKLLKQGRMLQFENAGHLVHEENPAGVASAIVRFASDFGIDSPAKRLRKIN